jgi:hypothetical protein
MDNHRPGDPEGVRPEFLQRLGIRFYFDTNFVTDESEAAESLRLMHEDGWINLWRTDTVDTELQGAKDEKRDGLLAASAPYVESMGPLVLDNSRWDGAVWGNDEDAERIDSVFRILFPDSDRDDHSTGRARRKLRDAMHVATSIRYAGSGLVTRDDEDLLSKSAEIAAEFNGFRIMTPEVALAFAERGRSRYDARES